MIIRSRYGPAVDVWSVACILFELLTGDQLFHPRASKKHSKDDDHGEEKKNVIILFFHELTFLFLKKSRVDC